MKDDVVVVHELVQSATLARFRILRAEGQEHPDRSWQRVACHLHREDVSWGAVPLLYVLGALSFGDARPRGVSGIDYDDQDEWLIADLVQRIRVDRAGVWLETDYVRGRMMKTTVTVRGDGRFTVETVNRHEAAVRWLRTLKGKKHLRLVEPPPGSGG
jgi:hypothetical protein